MDTKPKKTLVLGASDKPERYSFLAINRLRSHGHPVIAIGKRVTSVSDVPVTTEQVPIDDLDTVSVYLNPSNQKTYYPYILSLHPRRIIFNPGAENDELFDLAEAHGIKAMEACTLVLLSSDQF